ncbi:glutathione reductase [Paenibacillus amylolyticus]|uniref:Glutathione reductase n=1 Tax=Paenibacillus amylolyticus TaxID=1451 RepID=A0A5M9WRT7_PAEAM|nr:glutathione reductase [Paenibacillus amylolyticus]KAA8784354.1 glutathione reductase [Paenibacillus amylolyticus]
MSTLQPIIHVLQHSSDEDVIEQFFEYESLIWIDWREDEGDVIHYFNDQLPEPHQIQCKIIQIDKPRGVDIVLSSDERTLTIPFADDRTDRDSAVRAMEEMIAPQYQIRWFMESLGSDTLAFLLLSTEQWGELENQFGKEKLEFHFQPVTSESAMFSLDMDDVFTLVETRQKARTSE